MAVTHRCHLSSALPPARSLTLHSSNAPTTQICYVGQNGTDWDSNRPVLEQAGKTILDKLAKDTLPGIKPADVAALKTAWDAYQAVEGEQAGEQTDLRTERGTLSELMEKIKTGRKDVQLAADSEWPASDKANAGTRQEFRLPLNRSLKA